MGEVRWLIDERWVNGGDGNKYNEESIEKRVKYDSGKLI